MPIGPEEIMPLQSSPGVGTGFTDILVLKRVRIDDKAADGGCADE